MNTGIDYGLGKTNIDNSNGVRYGVISMHSIMPEAYAELEPVYPCEDCEYKDKDYNDDNYMCDCCEAIGLEYTGIIPDG